MKMKIKKNKKKSFREKATEAASRTKRMEEREKPYNVPYA